MKFIKLWLPVLIWTGFIFFLSSQPDLKSDLPQTWDFFFRKIAHMAEYGILIYLLFRAFRGYDLNSRKSLILAITFSFLYAISDEYHQSFVFGREGTARDVVIDTIGIIAVSLWIKRKKLSRRK